MRARGAILAGLAATAGLLLGWRLAGRELARYREDLFHHRPLRRFAALTSLADAPAPGTVALVRDYVRWERQPLLRRRARQVLRRLEAALG